VRVSRLCVNFSRTTFSTRLCVVAHIFTNAHSNTSDHATHFENLCCVMSTSNTNVNQSGERETIIRWGSFVILPSFPHNLLQQHKQNTFFTIDASRLVLRDRVAAVHCACQHATMDAVFRVGADCTPNVRLRELIPDQTTGRLRPHAASSSPISTYAHSAA
jgi:hypothetical protein